MHGRSLVWVGKRHIVVVVLPRVGGEKEYVQDRALEQIRNEGYNHKSTAKIYI